MSSNDEDPAVTRDQEVMVNEEEVGAGSNGDPAATQDQEVKENEEVDVGEGPAEGGEPVAVGGGDGPVEGPAEGGEHVAGGGGDGPVIVVAAVAGPSSYTDREVEGLTTGQALAAVRRGSLSAPQMSRLLDGCRRFVEVAAEAGVSLEEAQKVAAIQAAAASQAVEEAKAAAEEAKAAAAEATAAAVAQAAAVANAAAAALAAAVTQAPGSVGAIERMLQDALQGPGHSDAGLVAGLTAGLPTDQQIQIVLPFLQDPSEGLVPARVATALFQGFGRPAAATVAALLAASPTASCAPDAGLSADYARVEVAILCRGIGLDSRPV